MPLYTFLIRCLLDFIFLDIYIYIENLFTFTCLLFNFSFNCLLHLNTSELYLFFSAVKNKIFFLKIHFFDKKKSIYFFFKWVHIFYLVAISIQFDISSLNISLFYLFKKKRVSNHITLTYIIEFLFMYNFNKFLLI